ncbi:universal stress protein [Nitrospira sp.]|nr:universal stress protein [Nitrospira sp.]
MRAVIAVDWSDQAFNAVQVTCRLFTPDELTLIHGVDTRPFESPLTAPPMAKQAAADLRQALIDAGERLLGQSAELVPSAVKSVRRLYQIGNPADVVLETVKSAHADLVTVGTRGRGRIAEMFLGSVSHRVVSHAGCASLVVRGDPGPIRRVLVAIEGEEDAARLRSWLSAHRFNEAVEMSLLSVVPVPQLGDPSLAYGYAAWTDEMEKYAQEQVRETADALSSLYKVSAAQVVKGDAVDQIADASHDAQLVVIGSHGRRGMERFLLGSVSHAVLHHVNCPVLVIR